jgi:hypothetical protein
MTTTPQLCARQAEDARRTSAQLSALLMCPPGTPKLFLNRQGKTCSG